MIVTVCTIYAQTEARENLSQKWRDKDVVPALAGDLWHLIIAGEGTPDKYSSEETSHWRVFEQHKLESMS